MIGEAHRPDRRAEFLQFLRTIEANVPGAMQVHPVMDDYGTPQTGTIRSWVGRHPRFQVHFTPASPSRLNQVGGSLATLTENYPRRDTQRSTRQLEQAIKQYLDIINTNRSKWLSVAGKAVRGAVRHLPA